MLRSFWEKDCSGFVSLLFLEIFLSVCLLVSGTLSLALKHYSTALTLARAERRMALEAQTLRYLEDQCRCLILTDIDEGGLSVRYTRLAPNQIQAEAKKGKTELILTIFVDEASGKITDYTTEVIALE